MTAQHVALSKNPAWIATRKRILVRDNYQCQIRLNENCLGKATQVDHIRALREGGARFDERNLRAACSACNGTLGARLGRAHANVSMRKHSRAW